MINWGGSERRRYPRLKGATVEYAIVDTTAVKEMSFTEDISAVGIRMFASEEIKLDTVLEMRIYLPSYPEAIDAKGKVVWIRRSAFLAREGQPGSHFDVGIEFVELSDDDKERICQYTYDQPGAE